MSEDRWSRLELVWSAAGLARLTAARVLVVGLGAVGGHCLEALARAGVGALRLIDPDHVEPSNLNRQLLALEATVGQPKAELAAARVLAINAACQVEAHIARCSAANAAELLAGVDLVVDCMDSADDKIDLLLAALAAGVPQVVSLGAALRRDPTLIRRGPLRAVTVCPLGRRLRTGLRARAAPPAAGEVACVYSLEPPLKAALGAPSPDGARRALGSLPTVPGVVGLSVAATGLDLLLGACEE